MTTDFDMSAKDVEEQSPKKKIRIVRHPRCDREFYDVPCVELARCLLGQVLVSSFDAGDYEPNNSQQLRVSGRIVETEAYLGGEDKASNSCGGRRTPGNVGMFMTPGTAYVYLTYGMYHCMNISSKGSSLRLGTGACTMCSRLTRSIEINGNAWFAAVGYTLLGEGAAVLLRAVEPLEGLELMRSRRGMRRKDRGSTLKVQDLCNGPSKLCQSFAVTKGNADRKDLASGDSRLWVERVDDDFCSAATDIVCAPRIGIDSVVKEWASKPLRFYVRNSSYVSVRNKQSELVESNST